MLFTLQLLHTIFAVSLYAAILGTLFFHATGRTGRLLNTCYLLILLEVGALALNGFRCPISTYIASEWGNGTPTSLFPRIFRNTLLEGGVGLFAISLLLLLGRKAARLKRS